jgi:amidophosphoribosyltransferase
MRISSPPTSWPCYYGIDTPERTQLIGSSHSAEQIRDFIEADSLGYLSEDGLLEAVRNGDDPRSLYCTACFTGNYLKQSEKREEEIAAATV